MKSKKTENLITYTPHCSHFLKIAEIKKAISVFKGKTHVFLFHYVCWAALEEEEMSFFSGFLCFIFSPEEK